MDRQARKGTGPSDHAPVIVDLDHAPDGDVGPMVPPPSAPRSARRRPTRLPTQDAVLAGPGGGSQLGHNVGAAARAHLH